MCVFLQELLQFSLQQIQNSKKILSIVKCPGNTNLFYFYAKKLQ